MLFRKRTRKILLTTALFLFTGLIFLLLEDRPAQIKNVQIDDLQEIQLRKKLRITTGYNSTSYFIFKGQPLGFQLELIESFAAHLGVDYEILINNDLDKSFECLLNGQCDIIALDLSITEERSKIVNFAVPHSQTRQVLVQRKPENYRMMSRRKMEKHMLRTLLDLGGKTVVVPQKTSYAERLKHVSREIGHPINVVEVPGYGSENLIGFVSEGLIDYTVCDEHQAMVNQTYYPNIDVKTSVSFLQNLAWAVNKESSVLLDSINAWLSLFLETREYQNIYNKYYRNPRSKKIKDSKFFSVDGTHISPYDEHIKQASEMIGWDWRLMASLIFQESRFQPELTSWAGAYGLMQLMPATAARYGAPPGSGTEANIMAGARYIAWLDKRYSDIEDEQERVKFILASYNIGHGHIEDARRLAGKYDADSCLWEDNVAHFLTLKSNPDYYRDPVVRAGYARGKHTVQFVDDILTRYTHYVNAIKE